MSLLQNIFSEIMGVPQDEIRDDLSRTQVEAWDSFNHLLLISEVEKQTGVELTMQETNRIGTFGELREIVRARSKP